MSCSWHFCKICFEGGADVTLYTILLIGPALPFVAVKLVLKTERDSKTEIHPSLQKLNILHFVLLGIK